ncbi:MAG TPA: LptA/OstA family protein [Chthoniobacterales bacterium]|jgi:lipopolysaccharide export system protein LptA|nr:LptA/OstA family protein [Chthoniobacterales bacterium]
MSKSRLFWFLVIGFFPGVILAQSAASPKATARASAHASGSAAGTNKKGAGTEKGTAESKKTPGAFGDSDSSKGPTEITAKEEVDFDANAHTAIFVGNVKVIDPQFTMTTDKLTVWMNKQEDGGGIKDAQADGNVIIVHVNQSKDKQTADGSASPRTTPVANTAVTPSATTFGNSSVFGPSPSPSPSATPPVLDTGRAQKALYNAKQDAVTLIGWPQVTQGINTHIATEEGTRMILYRDGRLQTFGPSRTVIEDKKSMGSPSPSPGEPLVEPNNVPKNNAIH